MLSSFTQYDTTIDQVFDPNEVTDISNKYLLDTKDGILPIPLTTGLDALSPFTISITADNGSMESTNEFDHIWYDFSIDYNYQLNMDDDNVLNIKRDPGNMKVLKYFYDENFGVLESLFINGVSYDDDDDGELPECFGIKSSGACYISVLDEHQLSELNIIGVNMWGGESTITLPEITLEQLNPVTPDPIHYIFEGLIYEWVIIILALTFAAFMILRIVKKYSSDR